MSVTLAHWITFVSLAIGGILLMIGMIRALRAERPNPDPESTPWFRIPLAIVIVVCAYLVAFNDRAAIDASIARERAMILSFSTQACPERRAGDADALVITVHSYADGRPEDRRMTCVRIPQRAYELRFPQFKAHVDRDSLLVARKNDQRKTNNDQRPTVSP